LRTLSEKKRKVTMKKKYNKPAMQVYKLQYQGDLMQTSDGLLPGDLPLGARRFDLWDNEDCDWATNNTIYSNNSATEMYD